MADQQYVVLNLAALTSGGEVVVGPMSFVEAVLWIGGGGNPKVGHVILECHDPTLVGNVNDVVEAIKLHQFVDNTGYPCVKKIQAIKELRTMRHNSGNPRDGLKDCKDDIDEYCRKHNIR